MPPKKKKEEQKIERKGVLGGQTQAQIMGQEFIGEREKRASLMGGTKRAQETAAINLSIEEEARGELPVARTVEETQQERGVLAQQLGKAGVFKETKIEPIIPPELEGAGVIWDIGLNLIPGEQSKFLGRIKKSDGTPLFKGQAELKRLIEEEKETITPQEMELQNQILKSTLQQSTSQQIDDQTEEVVVTQMGLGLGAVVLGSGIGSVVGGLIGAPISQAVNSDKKVKNLENGLLNINELMTIAEGGVASGSLSPSQAFGKLNGWENIINYLEREVKKAGIDSPNVRVSARALSIETRVLKLRERLQDQRREIARIQISRGLETNNPEEIEAFMAQMEERFKQMNTTPE